jgi:transposase
MNAHQNARTTPLGRATLVRRVLEEGWTRKAVAEAFGLSERTVGKWLARYRQAALAGLRNRSSAARQVANRLPEPWVDMIVRLRREYRMTGQEIAERLQLPRSTVAGHLTRIGHRRSARPEQQGRLGARSTTPPGSPMSRSCRTRNARRPPAS